MTTESAPSKVLHESPQTRSSPYTLVSNMEHKELAKDQQTKFPLETPKVTAPGDRPKDRTSLGKLKSQSSSSLHTSAIFAWGDKSSSSCLCKMASQSACTLETSATSGWGDKSSCSCFCVGVHYDDGCEATEEETSFDDTEFGESLRSRASLLISEARERALAAQHGTRTGTPSDMYETSPQKKIETPNTDKAWNELVRLLGEANVDDSEGLSDRKEVSGTMESKSSMSGKFENWRGSRPGTLAPLIEMSRHSGNVSDVSLRGCTKSSVGSKMEQDSEEEDDSGSEDDSSGSFTSEVSSHRGDYQEGHESGNLCRSSRNTEFREIRRSTLTADPNQVDLEANEESLSGQEVVSLSLSQAFECEEEGDCDEEEDDETETEDDVDMNASYSLVFEELSVASTVSWMEDDECSECSWEGDHSMEEKFYKSFSTENALSPGKMNKGKVSTKCLPPRPLSPLIKKQEGIQIRGELKEALSNLARRTRTRSWLSHSADPGLMCELDSLDYHRKHTRARVRGVGQSSDEMNSIPLPPVKKQEGIQASGESQEASSSMSRRARTRAWLSDSVNSSLMYELDSLDYHRKHTKAKGRGVARLDEMDSLVYHRRRLKSRDRCKNDDLVVDIDSLVYACSLTERRLGWTKRSLNASLVAQH